MKRNVRDSKPQSQEKIHDSEPSYEQLCEEIGGVLGILTGLDRSGTFEVNEVGNLLIALQDGDDSPLKNLLRKLTDEVMKNIYKKNKDFFKIISELPGFQSLAISNYTSKFFGFNQKNWIRNFDETFKDKIKKIKTKAPEIKIQKILLQNQEPLENYFTTYQEKQKHHDQDRTYQQLTEDIGQALTLLESLKTQMTLDQEGLKGTEVNSYSLPTFEDVFPKYTQETIKSLLFNELSHVETISKIPGFQFLPKTIRPDQLENYATYLHQILFEKLNILRKAKKIIDHVLSKIEDFQGIQSISSKETEEEFFSGESENLAELSGQAKMSKEENPSLFNQDFEDLKSKIYSFSVKKIIEEAKALSGENSPLPLPPNVKVKKKKEQQKKAIEFSEEKNSRNIKALSPYSALPIVRLENDEDNQFNFSPSLSEFRKLSSNANFSENGSLSSDNEDEDEDEDENKTIKFFTEHLEEEIFISKDNHSVLFSSDEEEKIEQLLEESTTNSTNALDYIAQQNSSEANEEKNKETTEFSAEENFFNSDICEDITEKFDLTFETFEETIIVFADPALSFETTEETNEIRIEENISSLDDIDHFSEKTNFTSQEEITPSITLENPTPRKSQKIISPEKKDCTCELEMAALIQLLRNTLGKEFDSDHSETDKSEISFEENQKINYEEDFLKNEDTPFIEKNNRDKISNPPIILEKDTFIEIPHAFFKFIREVFRIAGLNPIFFNSFIENVLKKIFLSESPLVIMHHSHLTFSKENNFPAGLDMLRWNTLWKNHSNAQEKHVNNLKISSENIISLDIDSNPIHKI